MTSIEKTTCRLCFSTSDNYVNIFSAQERDGLTSIGRMIVDCLLSELEPNTGYPEIVCQFCQLQLNVFYEFKKKVFINHDKFTSILNKTKYVVKSKAKTSVESSKKDSTKDITKVKGTNRRCTRSTIKLEKDGSNSTEDFECGSELIISDLADQDDSLVKNETHSNDLKRQHSDKDNDDDKLTKYIKLETDPIENDVEELFRDEENDETHDDTHDETEQYLEEQYLENYSETEDNTEIEYIYEEDLDDENCNNFNEETEGVNVGRNVKKTRKPKTPKIKKFLTERVLDADTMREYDAVKCLNCSEYFETMDKFTTHHKACDKKACTICGKMLSSSGMDLHLKQHDGEKPYTCAICAKGFTTAQQCADHEFRHKNQRPFECNMCSKTFKMKCDLRTHIMCHQDIRKHACPICGKRFRMRSHVTAHLETHNENNVYECTECGLMLKTSSSLKGHISQMHSTSYKHNCPVCSRGFAKLDRFKTHENT